ncbi:hypothetical protein R70331_09180 [Paenibacillus sp. FSL R7-0331]|nr:hypothetical protein R70331_09180 [Paenibacillus sp. FSL R7-0331]
MQKMWITPMKNKGGVDVKNQETWKKRPGTNPHIVFVFSHTFGQFTLMVAECIRFFAYIWLVCPLSGLLYSVFRIH